MDTSNSASHDGDKSQQKPASSPIEESDSPPSEGPIFADDHEGESLDELESLRGELAEFKDRYVRMMAEVENIRRRTEREKAELAKYAFEGFFKDLLPTLDSLEKALPSSGDSTVENTEAHSAYFEGMVMVKRQLLDVLRRHGLEIVRASGVDFDPNLHQAIQRIESPEVAKDTVKDEYALGYTLHGRLLRAAMVSVLTPAGSS
jgi:molecular chaperone GrpE